MATSEKGSGVGLLEVGAVLVVGLFAVVLLFVLFGFIAGIVWWLIKIAVLVLVLFLIVRWAFKRASR